MIHLDLFSGIGGFSYAADQVWDNVDHIFCEIDPFCRQVIKKHWPESEIYNDVRTLFTDPQDQRKSWLGLERQPNSQTAKFGKGIVDLVTGGFPCQPFSSAGLRGGTDDKRHLWPEMLTAIQTTSPAVVIAENVSGILTWNEGMVFEQVCSDLENAGYEVQPFVIPAAGVGAPHRRDRVWFMAYTVDERRQRRFKETVQGQQALPSKPARIAEGWREGWPISKPRTIRVDDGVPDRVDRIAALGNSIVPQVAVELMRGLAALV